MIEHTLVLSYKLWQKDSNEKVLLDYLHELLKKDYLNERFLHTVPVRTTECKH